MRRAILTIEVLISLLILFMIVAISITSVKHLDIIRTQQVRYGNVYRAVNNIKDYISADICSKKFSMDGHLNGFKYHAVCKQQAQKRNYVVAFQSGDRQGNIGNLLAILSKVTITLKKGNFKKSYTYQKFTTRRLF